MNLCIQVPIQRNRRTTLNINKVSFQQKRDNGQCVAHRVHIQAGSECAVVKAKRLVKQTSPFLCVRIQPNQFQRTFYFLAFP